LSHIEQGCFDLSSGKFVLEKPFYWGEYGTGFCNIAGDKSDKNTDRQAWLSIISNVIPLVLTSHYLLSWILNIWCHFLWMSSYILSLIQIWTSGWSVTVVVTLVSAWIRTLTKALACNYGIMLVSKFWIQLLAPPGSVHLTKWWCMAKTRNSYLENPPDQKTKVVMLSHAKSCHPMTAHFSPHPTWVWLKSIRF
jgi:hypothetical protein